MIRKIRIKKTRIPYLYAAIIMTVLSIGFMTSGVFNQTLSSMSIAVFLLWGSAVSSALCNKKRNLIYLCFLAVFFIFLLSLVMAKWIETGEIYAPFSVSTMENVYWCLYLSIAGLMIGSFWRLKKTYTIQAEWSKTNRRLMENIVVPLVVITGVATALVALEKVAYFLVAGEVGLLRTAFKSSIPSIITYPAYMYTFLFCMYLATFPKKRNAKLLILQYVVVNAIKLAYGSRGDFILALIFVSLYFVIRDKLGWYNNNIPEKEKWVTGKEKVFVVAMIPTLMVLAVFVQYFRKQTAFDFKNIFDIFNEFFSSQGVSINVIGYADQYKDFLPQPNWTYLLGGTIEFLKTNPLSRIVFGTRTYSINTIERATLGNNFGATISYLANQSSFLSGHGMGSSYVAEAYVGYGFLGVFLVNVVLSILMKLLNQYQFKSFICSVIAFVYLQALFFIPRSGFDDFIGDCTSLTHLLTIAFVCFVYNAIKRKNHFGLQ